MPHKPDTPCTICGKLTWSGNGSRPADLRICLPCRRDPAKPGRTVGPRGTVMKLECSVCKSAFEWIKTGSTVRKTCSEACRHSIRSRAGIAARSANGDPTGEFTGLCRDCEVPIADGSAKLRCTPCRKARLAEQYRQKCRRRRVLKRGGVAEPYSLPEIAERDRHRCQLCRRKVDLTIQWPDPKSPSIDHVIPVTEGGDDTKANVQLAHLGCNVSKGAKGSQQLALVG